MNITHICLAGMVTEGWSYQENMLIKYHMANGHAVTMITSQWIRSGKTIKKCVKTDYIGEYGAHYVRLPITNKDAIDYRFKRYSGLLEAIEQSKPDLIFIHNFQFIDIKTVAKYLNDHPVPLLIDSHSDFSNSGSNFISRIFLHKCFWRHYAHLIEPYVTFFYGVLPARVDFLTDVYGFPKEKCRLLVMGVDDELARKAKASSSRSVIRKKYGISENDFLIMTGGKIDKAKRQTLLLMQAVKKIKCNRLKLLIFGSVDSSFLEEFNSLCDGNIIQFAGWVDSANTYDYIDAADLFVFPGRHSVYWEQVAGLGIPMIVKDWAGTHHVDLGGNVLFLKEDTVQEIQFTIESILFDSNKYSAMKRAAEKGIAIFSYDKISRRAIEI